jgi:PST family polysaccharide transporter
LGLLTNPTVVGYYSAAEKIVKATSGLLGPLSQASYPRFSKMASKSKALVLQWGRRMLFLMGIIGFILSLALLLGSSAIVRLVLGTEYELSIMVVRILAPLPFLIAISNILGVQIMFAFRYEKKVFTRVLLAGLINIILAILLAPILKASGMAIAVLSSEAFITISYFTYLWNKGENPLQKVSKINHAPTGIEA